MISGSKEKLARILLVSVATVGVLTGFPTTAEAVSIGGNCYAQRGEIEVWGPNAIYVRSYCTGMTSVTKARGVLDISGNSDKQTVWFTDLGVWHQSDSYRCIPGTCDNVRVEMEHR